MIKKPNSIGLFDMAGNVLEWCWDWYSSINNTTLITGAPSGSTHINRGGCFLNSKEAIYCYNIGRNSNGLSHRCYDLGFRVVRSR